MTNPHTAGEEIRAARHHLDLSLERMGRALGFQGTPQTIKTQIHRYETGKREPPLWIRRLAYMYQRWGIPETLVGPSPDSGRVASRPQRSLLTSKRQRR